jgi:UDP-2,3-diacylglucosamine hydrolase
MVRALFVSDIHIVSPEDPKHRLFIAFLERCLETRPEHLFLVGDIFDLWVADRSYFVGRYGVIAAAIRALVEAGVRVHYFEGNHDLDLEVYWRRELGVDTHGEAAYFDIAGRTVRVEHGDQMDPDDRGYLFLRWFLRTPLLRLLGRRLPDALIRRIGERASRASREYTSTVKTAAPETARAKTETHARRAWLARPFDIFVSGHVHVSADQTVDMGEGRSFRCFNLGTWLDEPLVLRLGDERDELTGLEDFLHG